MRRFEFDDEDEDEGFPNLGPNDYLISPEEYKNILEDEIAIHNAKYYELERKMKYKVLIECINLLKNSFFWKFYSLNTRLKKIETAFTKFKLLLELEEK